jgi:hypothetical protein
MAIPGELETPTFSLGNNGLKGQYQELRATDCKTDPGGFGIGEPVIHFWGQKVDHEPELLLGSMRAGCGLCGGWFRELV